MATGVHRVTPTSKSGRRMTSGGGLEYNPYAIPKDIQEHNRKIDEARAAKKAAKKERK